MRKWLTWWMVRRVSEKPAPDIIPMGGDAEKIAIRDYFTLHLSSDNERYLFRGIDQGGLKFARFTKATHAFDEIVFLSLRDVASMVFVCDYYHRESQIRFSNRLDFFLSMSLGLWKLQQRSFRLVQWLFNRKTLATTKRFQMMQFICDSKMADPGFSLNLYSRVRSVYGERFWHHPDKDELIKKEEFLLDSLVATGDLIKEKAGITYKISPKILASFEAVELDERRTSRANRIQLALCIVAVVSAAAAFVQAWAAVHGQHLPMDPQVTFQAKAVMPAP